VRPRVSSVASGLRVRPGLHRLPEVRPGPRQEGSGLRQDTARSRGASRPGARLAVVLLGALAVHLGIMVSPAHAVAAGAAPGAHHARVAVPAAGVAAGASSGAGAATAHPGAHAPDHPSPPAAADHPSGGAGAVLAAGPVGAADDCALNPGRPPAPPAVVEPVLSQRAPSPPPALRPGCRPPDRPPGHRANPARLRALLQVFRI
jgi:hypothetical protein